MIGMDNFNTIDYMFLDTEGHDCDIIQSTDFSKLLVDEICFEIAHTDGSFTGTETDKYKKTNEHLNSFGFFPISLNTEISSITYKNKNFKLSN
jgi:hypothetical protein